MALDLNTEDAVDYGDNDTPLLNVSEEFTGEFDLEVLGYTELVGEEELSLRRREIALELGVKPDEVTDDQLPRVAYNGACDIATVRVLTSDNAAVKPGSTWGLWFTQHATGKALKFARGRIRQFMAACVQVDFKAFDANAARKALLATDMSGGGVRIQMKTRLGRPDEDGKQWSNSTYYAGGE